MKLAFLFLIACTTLAFQATSAETLDPPEANSIVEPTAEPLAQPIPSAVAPPATTATAPVTEAAPEFDSRKMEKDLQQLPWKQARSIIESVPKLKASVDAYGPLGWQFVETNYSSYGWRKKINKLDASQKSQLAELIRKAQHSRH